MGLLYLIDLIKDYNNKYIYERVYKKPHLIPIRRTVSQVSAVFIEIVNVKSLWYLKLLPVFKYTGKSFLCKEINLL